MDKCVAVAFSFCCLAIAGYFLLQYKFCLDKSVYDPKMGFFFGFGITFAGIGANMLVTLTMHHLLSREALATYQKLRSP